MSAERIVVQRSVVEKFCNVLAETAEEVFGKSAPGPVLIASAAVNKNKGLVTPITKVRSTNSLPAPVSSIWYLINSSLREAIILEALSIMSAAEWLRVAPRGGGRLRSSHSGVGIVD